MWSALQKKEVIRDAPRKARTVMRRLGIHGGLIGIR
jgi:hypothetical protein